MSYWNNRVLYDGKDYWVGEVYYENNGTPFAYTGSEQGDVGAWGDFIELTGCIHNMVGALDLPILRVDPKTEEFIGEVTLTELTDTNTDT